MRVAAPPMSATQARSGAPRGFTSSMTAPGPMPSRRAVCTSRAMARPRAVSRSAAAVSRTTTRRARSASRDTAPTPYTVSAAAADAERRQHGLLGEDRELRVRRQDPHLARQPQAATPAAGAAGVLAQRGALHADGIELLDGLDRLQRGHVALGPRAHRVAAVAAVEAAGAAGRVLVEDERLAGPRVRPADVAVVAATLEVARHLAV